MPALAALCGWWQRSLALCDGGCTIGIVLFLVVCRETKALVALVRYLLALDAVVSHSANVGHKDAGFAGNVRSKIPRVRAWEQGETRYLVDVGHPGILSFNLGFNAAAMMFAHILDTVTDPFYVLFDRDGHIAQYGWAAGACDDEEIREASGHNAQIGTRSVSPFLFEELAVLASYLHIEESAGHGIKTGGAYNRIQFVLGILCAQTGRCDLLNGRCTHVHQGNILAVIRLVVSGIDADTLGADGMIMWHQQSGDLRVMHRLANLCAYKIRHVGVRFKIDANVRERCEHLKPSDCPHLLELFLSLLRRDFEGRLLVARDSEACCRFAVGLAELAVVRLDAGLFFWREGAIARRKAIVWGALKHGNMSGLPGDLWDDLDARRTGANHAHPLAAKVNPFMRPLTGVIHLPLEGSKAWKLRGIGRRKAADRRDAVPCRHLISLVRLDHPEIGAFIVNNG